MTLLASSPAPSPSDEADRVVAAVLDDLRHGSDLGVVVDSPPGAGKSTLVVRAALALAEDSSQVMVVAQTNEQVDDLVHRLAVAAPALLIGRLSAGDYVPSRRVAQHSSVLVRSSIADLKSVAIVVATAAKWTFVTEGSWAVGDRG